VKFEVSKGLARESFSAVSGVDGYGLKPIAVNICLFFRRNNSLGKTSLHQVVISIPSIFPAVVAGK
jgi:hypothetical protein